MNYKIIVIFTSLLLVFGILAGIPFGIWSAEDELISNALMFHLGIYVVCFVVECIVFYFLYMQKINKPIQHALTIGILYLVISDSLLYVLVGIKPLPLLIVIDVMSIISAILLTMYIARNRGKLSVSA